MGGWRETYKKSEPYLALQSTKIEVRNEIVSAFREAAEKIIDPIVKLVIRRVLESLQDARR